MAQASGGIAYIVESTLIYIERNGLYTGRTIIFPSQVKILDNSAYTSGGCWFIDARMDKEKTATFQIISTNFSNSSSYQGFFVSCNKTDFKMVELFI